MISACTLITCETGKYEKVVDELRKLDGVVKAFGVHGRWDAVAEIEVEDMEALGDLALRLNGLDEVLASETLVGFGEG